MRKSTDLRGVYGGKTRTPGPSASPPPPSSFFPSSLWNPKPTQRVHIHNRLRPVRPTRFGYDSKTLCTRNSRDTVEGSQEVLDPFNC